MISNTIKIISVLVCANILVGCCIGDCKEDPNAKNYIKNTVTDTHCPEGLTQQAMLEAVNKVRSEGRYCGATFYPAVESLVWNGHLAQSASLHAKDMADNNYFSHESQDGRTMEQRIIAAGYANNSYKAENISAGRKTLDDTINGWIASEGHCKNMMSPDYQDFGMACASNANSEYTTYWVQNFGKQ
ncbi:CAP domain-containing protein [Psychrobacter sp. I-STPA10]|uniref:CAP domain-containing protein n=1 Tax=Psychrobacter sp. I-STPA10 TaxID=2585769 RepID=UPI001E62ECA5|nr:CAP domain-containing protein [Psychrobacter sp. I-STPA10]